MIPIELRAWDKNNKEMYHVYGYNGTETAKQMLSDWKIPVTLEKEESEAK